VTERNEVKRRNDGDGAGRRSAAFRARSFGRTPPPTGQDFTGRSEAKEEADGVTAARRWRVVCRLGFEGGTSISAT